MHVVFRTWLTTIFALLLLCMACTRAGADEPEPIATRQSAFSIPFQIDPNATSPPVEVQLYVSADRGGRWDLYDKVKPDRGSFVFRAPNDGEYWFSMRSRDQQGTVSPSGPYTAGLKVVVDTLVPRLDVTAERMPSGELSAQWQVVDPCLKPDSLKLECRTSDAEEWQELAASQARITEGRSTLSGDGVWWLPQVNGPVTLRIQVADRAGNPAVTQLVVKPIANAGSENVTGPSLGDPQQLTRLPETNVAPGAEETPADRRYDGTISEPQRDRQYRRETPAMPVSNAAQKETSVRRNPFEQYRDRPNHSEEAPSETTLEATAPPPGRPWPGQETHGNPLATNQGANPWRVANLPGNDRTPGFVHSSQQRESESSGRNEATHSPALQGGFDFGKLSPLERPKMVNSRTFQIDYEIESVGSAGVARVELFGTRDGGTTWTSLGTDPDNRSPLLVTVNGEGLYGFQVVVESASGLTGTPPRAGDRPELWIGVDLTKPQATLRGAEPGNNSDELVIYWDAQDARLESRPIALYFSDRPGGPWTPIAAGLHNTGSYTWRLDSRVKEQIYLRIEVRDEAGNIGLYETVDPVSLNRQLPQGRIRGVRPVSPSNGNSQALQGAIIENHFIR